MKKLLYLLTILILTTGMLMFSNCSSPGGAAINNGIINIILDEDTARASAWPPTTENSVLPDLEYRITLQGPSGIQNHTLQPGETSMKFSVSPGLWTVSIEAWYDGILFGTGISKTKKVATGQTTMFEINMVKSATEFYVASNPSEWSNVITAIQSAGTGSYVINITHSFAVPGSTANTFGSVTGINVIIRGNGPLSLNSQGSLLRIAGGQTVTINDIKLQGRNDNNTPLVNIASNGTLIMQGSASISENTNVGDGGGVFVGSSGTFNMSSGNITDNKANRGGGVFVADGGVFNRSGGTINGNTATSGEGHNVYPDDYASFTVTFDSNGGSSVSSQTVNSGGTATQPASPSKTAAAGLYQGSLTTPPGFTFDGWYLNESPFNFSTPITGDITLVAAWTTPASLVDSVAANNITAAISYISTGTYTLFIDGDVNSPPQTINAGVNLTIIGLGAEREIRLSSQGALFLINNGAELTLGNNVTLVGLTIGQNSATQNNSNSVVNIAAGGGTFTMETGSKITGNTTNFVDGSGVYVNSSSFLIINGGTISNNSTDLGGGGIVIDGGILTMSAGTISNNSAGNDGGGVSVFNNGTFNMTGGNIINNTAGTWGGGVVLASGTTFSKTGSSIIAGFNGPSPNEVKVGSTLVDDSGHAVAELSTAIVIARKRDSTAGYGENMDNGIPGDGWDPP